MSDVAWTLPLRLDDRTVGQINDADGHSVSLIVGHGDWPTEVDDAHARAIVSAVNLHESIVAELALFARVFSKIDRGQQDTHWVYGVDGRVIKAGDLRRVFALLDKCREA